MAKRKITKKLGTPKRGAKKGAKTNGAAKQSRKAAEAVLRKGPVQRRKPVTQALPGMEDLGVDSVLDGLCRSIAERSVTMADLRADDAGDKQAALNRMRQIKRTSYRRHGVEMARVPGEEKLRCRTARDTASAEVEPEPEDLEPMDAIEDPDAATDEAFSESLSNA